MIKKKTTAGINNALFILFLNSKSRSRYFAVFSYISAILPLVDAIESIVVAKAPNTLLCGPYT